MTASEADQDVRIVRAIREALASVPFYASYSKQGVAPPAEGVSRTSALAAMPLLTRDKIRPTLPKAWMPSSRDAKAELATGKIAVVETGLGEARVRVLLDGAWWRAQERRAFGLNETAAAAMQGPYMDAVLWEPTRGTGSCGAGDPSYEERLEGSRLHLNSRQDPSFWTDVVMTRMLDELTMHETSGLLADPFYLDILVRHAAMLGRRLDVKGFVGLSRSLTTASHRTAIKKVFSRPVLQIYSAREAGTLFVQGDDGLLHHAPFASHVELIPAKRPTPGARNVAFVVVTTLDREVMPLVRYVIGDLVEVAPSAGLPVPSLVGVEGRLDDSVILADGAIVTPGAIDRALAPLELRGYQLTQRAAGIEIEIIGSARGVAAALEPLVGAVDVRAATAITVDPNGKYRTTRRIGVPFKLEEAFS